MAGSVVVACAGPIAPTPSPVTTARPNAPTPSSVAPTSSPEALTFPSAVPVRSESPPTRSGPTVPTVTIDPSLLAVLPSTVSGLPMTTVDQPAGVDDPEMAKTVGEMAQGLVIDPVTNDFATSSVIRLRPGVYSPAYFAAWRDSFDEGACSQSGGVAGRSQATIAGRTVYVGTCQGGLTTYHVRLDAGDRIVSIAAFGEQLIGEQILADLRP